MPNEIVIGVAMITMIGLAGFLVDAADHISDKTVLFAHQTIEAYDCAIQGIDVKKCSPNLGDTSQVLLTPSELGEDLFKEEAVTYVAIDEKRGVLFELHKHDAVTWYYLRANQAEKDVANFELQEVHSLAQIRDTTNQDQAENRVQFSLATTQDHPLFLSKTEEPDVVIHVSEVTSDTVLIKMTNAEQIDVIRLAASWLSVFIVTLAWIISLYVHKKENLRS